MYWEDNLGQPLTPAEEAQLRRDFRRETRPSPAVSDQEKADKRLLLALFRRLTPKQEQAAETLASGCTIEVAARECGAAARTIKAWLASVPGFKRRVDELRAEERGVVVAKDWPRLYRVFRKYPPGVLGFYQKEACPSKDQDCPFCGQSAFHINRAGEYECECGERGDCFDWIKKQYERYLSQTDDFDYEWVANQRGVSKEVLKDHQLAYAKDLGPWLVPYRTRAGKVVNLLQYYCHNRYKLLLPCLETCLYGLDRLRYAGQRSSAVLVVCEGAFNAMALDDHLREWEKKDKFDVIALHSALIFRPQWCTYLEGYSQVWLCLNNNKAGRQGVQKFVAICKQIVPDLCLRVLEWPSRFPDKYDVGDLLRDEGYYFYFGDFCKKHCNKVV
jgi:hypothetical protein